MEIKPCHEQARACYPNSVHALRYLMAVVAAALAASCWAQDQGNALGVFNAFIARYAGDEIAWRAEIQLITDPAAPLKPGFLKGTSALGDFSYRPKLFTELKKNEQRALIRDVRLAAFIETLRGAAAADDLPAGGMAAVGAEQSDSTHKLAVAEILGGFDKREPTQQIRVLEVSADDVLSNAPVRIYLP